MSVDPDGADDRADLRTLDRHATWREVAFALDAQEGQRHE